MTRRFIGTLALASGVVAMAALPATAGQRPNTSGESSGTAVPRGGDSGGSVSSSSSSGSSSSGGSVSNSSGGGGGGDHSMPAPAHSSFDAPTRSSDQGSRARTGSSSGTATPRGGSSSSGSSSPRSTSSSSSPSGEHAASSGDSGSRRAVPEFSRPRDGRPVSGEAVSRGSVAPPINGGNTVIVYPYDPWGFWGGYGFGLGYLYYDPFGYGGYGFGYPGYGYGYGSGGYYGGGGTGGYSVSQSYRESGGLRLKINPKQAQVFVDGAYVGVVDSFNGTFQKLDLDSGGHKIELKADGFQPLQFDVLITPGETSIFKGEMKKIH